jgi:asparagine synthase (glutamine-hydrolysing)
MGAALAHRGPDDQGAHVDGVVGLGFRRLSIIDLEGGHQPMADGDRTVWVVFNGEIYNFRELRRELETLGHRFRTLCDTEVIVHGYKQWGTGVLDRLNGMFGLAIWDAKRERLLLARDAMGIKPLYYHVADGRLSFGSEVGAILAGLKRRPSVDVRALHDLLSYGYTPSPRTLWEGVRKLAPGTMAIVESGQLRLERWYLSRPTPWQGRLNEVDAAEELRAVYERALERQLVSDVPLGLLLSGGVDSALLLALMSRGGRRWHTYTVGYGCTLDVNDELADAADTAGAFGADHAEVMLDDDDFERQFVTIVGRLEEPIAASSIVPMYHVCARARQDVKVALIGQGPDELFGGYLRHLGVLHGQRWRQLPRWNRDLIAAAVRRLPRQEGLKRAVQALATADRGERYKDVLSILPRPTAAELLRPEHRADLDASSSPDWWSELEPLLADADELGGFLAVELRSALPDKLLMYGDKLSMAHGLEVRVPYLDREVVEFVERLPSHAKVALGQRKRLHRQVCRSLLPPAILRRKKRGFAVDAVDRWFRADRPGMVDTYLLDPSARIGDYLDLDAIGRLVDAHRRGASDHHKILFNLIALEAWLRADAESAGRTNAAA